MSTPYFTLLSIEGDRVDGKIARLRWNAEFYDSTGFRHFTKGGYMLDVESEHSPEARLAFAQATTPDDYCKAVVLDAKRCLADFESRLAPILPVDTVSIDLPVHPTFGADSAALQKDT